MIKKSLLCVALFGYITSLYGARLLVSDPEKSSESFPFPLSAQGFYIPDGRLFVAAKEKVNGNTFAVAAITRNQNIFKGITPALVRLNNVPEQNNPLRGAAISHLAMMGARPVVAKRDLPSSLFLINDAGNQNAVFEAASIRNAQGSVASSILGLTTSAAQVFVSLEAAASAAAFVAVGNNKGNFDGDGSGIALLFFKQFTEEKKKFFGWDIVDANTGITQFTDTGDPTNKGNKALPIEKDTAEIAIGEPVSAIGRAVDLHYDRDLGRLYIALQVEAGVGRRVGARALVAASISNGRLILQSIAPGTAFDDNTKIIGGREAQAKITLFKVRTLQTRTYLRYLIVVGGNGDDEDLKRRVWALPLVDNIRSASHGALADVKSDPITLFAQGGHQRFQARVFHKPATRPDQLFSMNSKKAQVGADGVLPGAITDIVVASEAVFVSVAKSGEGLQPGIFYSQPLFDVKGRIKRWTRWQRVAGTGEGIQAFSHDPIKGNFTYVPSTNGVKKQSVFRTEWSDGGDPLSRFASQEFALLEGGVQGLYDFPQMTPSFSKTIGQRIAVNIFTGFKKIVLMQTGQDIQGCFGPFIDLEACYRSTNGTLKGFIPSRVLSLSGGVLNELGPLNSAAVITDGIHGWFAVGGSHGVALLADAKGKGWDALQGLGSQFRGLSTDMVWKKISDVPNVRKLIAIKKHLFVLTDKTLERLEVAADMVAHEMVPSTTVAQVAEDEKALVRSFSDVIISGPLAILATSFGLLRSGNFINICTVPDADAAQWTQVDLPESAGSLTTPGPVSRLFAVSKNLQETDVAKQGNFYALNAYVGLSQALVYRFVVKLEQGKVTDRTVRLFPDFFIRRVKTFFVNLGDYRNYLVTDGALIAVSRSAFGGMRPLLELLSPTLKSGETNGARVRMPFVTIQGQTSSMGKLLRNSASGAWMVPGDFGVRVQD